MSLVSTKFIHLSVTMAHVDQVFSCDFKNKYLVGCLSFSWFNFSFFRPFGISVCDFRINFASHIPPLSPPFRRLSRGRNLERHGDKVIFCVPTTYQPHCRSRVFSPVTLIVDFASLPFVPFLCIVEFPKK